ncbi:Predicted exporter of the RND superfamily, partial [hydrothermal vent metagenome]
MKQFEEGLGRWVVRFRWFLIIASLLVAGAFGSGMANLTMSSDGRVFFSKENPQLQALEELENTYTKTENILFALAPKDGNVFTRKTLAAIEELTEASWQIPFSNRVDSITNYQHTTAEGDDLIVEDLVTDAMKLTDDELAQKRAVALAEPLLVNRIISDTGSVTGVNINVLKPGLDGNESPVVTNFAREIAKKFRANHPEIDLYISGGVLMDTAFGEAGAEDGATLLPIMFAVIFVLLGLLLRSITGIFSALMVLIMSVITGMGFAGLIGIDLTPASTNAPTIILTLAVADSIHLLVTLFHEMRNGKSKHEAIIESIRINLQPVFLTSVTTAIGFLTMNFSDAPPFHDLGNMVAVGVMAALVYSVLFLPALMAVLPVKVKPTPKGGWHLSKMADSLGRFVVARQKGLLWSMSALMLILASGVVFIQLDDNFVKYFDTRYEFRRASDFVSNNLSGLDIIEYSLKSGEPSGINKPDYLKKVEAFANWYRAQPNV